MLTADPLISSGLWTTLTLAAAALLVVYAWRRPTGIVRRRWGAIVALMATGMVLLLLLLLNLTWRQRVPPPPGKPLLTVLVDSSASMATRDGAAPAKSRYEAAVEVARAIEGGAGTNSDVEIRVRRFDEKTVAGSAADLAKLTPTGEVTDISGALVGSVEADRPQGQAVIVLSDGIQTDDAGRGSAELRAAARFAKAAGAPVYGVVLGGQGVGMDVAVEAHSVREISFAGQKVTLVADVRTRGYTGKATVHLLAEGKEIDKQMVDLVADKPAGAAARFEVTEKEPGLYPFEMRVEPAPGTVELTDANNSTLCLLRVVDKPVRVTLVEGKPYWDSKFLVRQMAADPSIELHSLVQMAPGRVLERVVSRGTGAATQGAATAGGAGGASDQWTVQREPGKLLADDATVRANQILVLGRDTEEFLSPEAIANLQRWLSRDGGALICYRGSPEAQVDPGLARLLPVKWQPAHEARYQMTLTDTGRTLNWFGGEADAGLGQLSALASDTRVESTKPLAVIVAQAQWQGREQSPAVTYQPYGAGRVVVIEGAGMWRWAFPPATGRSDVTQAGGTDVAYASVWHALFRWLISGAGLVPGEESAIRPDKIAFNAREPAAATVLTRVDQRAAAAKTPAALTVELKGPDGLKNFPCELSSDDPGAYRVQFGVLTAGRYNATLKGGAPAAAVFDVKRVGDEELNLAARPDLLRMLAMESGGEMLAPADASAVTQRMKENLARSRQERVMYVTAWDRLWIFVGILALWATAWGLRRASGLV